MEKTTVKITRVNHQKIKRISDETGKRIEFIINEILNKALVDLPMVNDNEEKITDYF